MSSPFRFDSFRRVVVKIGSALLVQQSTGLRRTWLESLADDLAELQQRGTETIVVSSGAIAVGRILLDSKQDELSFDRKSPLTLEASQAAAAVGQIELSRAYAEVLSARGISTGQVLLTLGDTEQRDRYLNARATIETLLSWKAVPVINENDTVATQEICYGDNDRLAARVATMMNADLLVLLSDVDGLYRQPPPPDPSDKFIAEHFLESVPSITPEIEAMAGGSQSSHGTGGMQTKLVAGKIATAAGTTMVITSGRDYHPLINLDAGKRATWFAPSQRPVADRKKWIGGHLVPAGKVHIDTGAESALLSGKSLLASGVIRIEGDFHCGDTVAIVVNGVSIGQGLISYDSQDAKRITGLNSDQIVEVLGPARRTELIHRDNLVLSSR